MDIEAIAQAVAAEWQMGFGGIELDFALEVAKRAIAIEREACAKVCDANAAHWRGMHTTANLRAAGLVLRGYLAREDSAADCATNIRERSNV